VFIASLARLNILLKKSRIIAQWLKPKIILLHFRHGSSHALIQPAVMDVSRSTNFEGSFLEFFRKL